MRSVGLVNPPNHAHDCIFAMFAVGQHPLGPYPAIVLAIVAALAAIVGLGVLLRQLAKLRYENKLLKQKVEAAEQLIQKAGAKELEEAWRSVWFRTTVDGSPTFLQAEALKPFITDGLLASNHSEGLGDDRLWAFRAAGGASVPRA